jgi:hypothetical protein
MSVPTFYRFNKLESYIYFQWIYSVLPFALKSGDM